MCAILRATAIYSELIPNNLGVIFRKEYVDLRDSTLKDFEEYTGFKVDSQRNVNLRNGSRIMFRHLEELNNLQNLNLGWYFIEQAEELPSDKEFFLLWGRLRRQLNPSAKFLDLGLPLHTGFITANVKGSNWIKSLWKDNPKEDFSLNEAITFDNADILPADYLKNLEVLKTIKPDIYKRFVLNDWGIEATGKIFKVQFIQVCLGGKLEDSIQRQRYVQGSDLAKHSDWAVNIVLKVGNPNQVVFFDRFQKVRWTSKSLDEDSVKTRILKTSNKYNNALTVPDSTGVGDPVVEELQSDGLNVYREQKKDRDGFVFTSTSKEQLIDNLVLGIETKDILIPPECTILIDELKDFESEETAAGNVRYSAPQGKNDDCVIALALAYWGCQSPQTVMSMVNILTGQRL